VRDAAVVGLQDPIWGQKVAAAVVCDDDVEEDELKRWCEERLAPYSTPKVFQTLSSMPRNQMGKVNKKELKRDVFDDR